MSGQSLPRFILLVALVALAVWAVLGRLDENASAAARQALLMREETLQQSAFAPGSMLPCVDSAVDGPVRHACEKEVFSSAESTAAAVAYMSARINLLRQAYALAERGDKKVMPAMIATRRAVMYDRYGIASHVLAGDGCTANQCGVFAMVEDDTALRADLKAQTFERYIARYAVKWRAPAAARGPAVSSAEPRQNVTEHAALPAAGAAPANQARAEATSSRPLAEHKPLPSRYKLPSADSIPPVSIMNPEPMLPKPVAKELDRDTSKKMAIERRKEGKPPRAETFAQGSKAKKHQRETEKQQKPGEPRQLHAR
jgi:hypothetical protein